MNSPPEPGSPSPTTPSSGSPPPDELQLPSTEHTQEADASPFSTSQSKKSTRAGGFLRGLKLRKKEDTKISIGGGGKQERGSLVGATSSWVEGTQRAMKEELVDQNVADQLKRRFGDPFDDSPVKSRA